MLIDRQKKPKKSEWWERSDLCRLNHILSFQNIDLRSILDDSGSPAYVYGLKRVEENVERLLRALEGSHSQTRLFYAMKSNRYEPFLKWLAARGNVGIDACSPQEVELAIKCGFKDSQISYTATGMSSLEWQRILSYPGIIVNVDSFGDIQKISDLAPGRNIGIRINSEVSLGYKQNEKLVYTGESCFSKFGISMQELPQAIKEAKERNLNIVGIHSHCGCGYLPEQLPAYESMLLILKNLLDEYPEVQYLNLGGGLGIPLLPDDEKWELGFWSDLLKRVFAGWGGELFLEPGDFIVKDAGVLLVEVTNVEVKCGKTVIWVNAGFNIHPEPVFYDLPLYPVPVVKREGPRENVTIVGNINEAHDIWFKDVDLSPLQEGDVIAFINAGGYGASMSSNHCCRGQFVERLLKE